MKISKILSLGTIILSSILIQYNTFASNDDFSDSPKIVSFGGSGTEYIYATIETLDGGFVAVGSSSSSNAGFTNKPSSGSPSIDAIIVKYDENGNQEWIKNFGGSGTEYFNSVVETSDEGFVCAGYSSSIDAGFVNKGTTTNYDAVLVKYDKDGNQEWIKNFGGSGADYFYSVVEALNGDLLICGTTASTINGVTNNGGYDGLVVRTSNDGILKWIKSFGGSGAESFNSIVETTDEGFVCAGYSASNNAGFTNNGYNDAVLVKYDKDGVQKWVKSFGGSGSDYFNSVVETTDEGLVCAGYSASNNVGFTNNGGMDAILVKYDKDGVQKWARNYGGSSDDYLKSITKSSDGGLIAVGETTSTNYGFENKGSYDIIIVKYNEDGKQQWIKSFGGANPDYATCVTISPLSGKLIISGYSSSSDAGFENKGGTDGLFLVYSSKNEYLNAIFRAESTRLEKDIERARRLVNELPEGELKEECQMRLNNISIISSESVSSNATGNLDLYITYTSMISLALDTNIIEFEDFSGVEDYEKLEAINLTVSSSLPYQINASLETEIQNLDKTYTVDKSILNIKESGEIDYNTFNDIKEKVILKDNCSPDNDVIHKIDIKLKGGTSAIGGKYRTIIKFEAEQK